MARRRRRVGACFGKAPPAPVVGSLVSLRVLGSAVAARRGLFWKSPSCAANRLVTTSVRRWLNRQQKWRTPRSPTTTPFLRLLAPSRLHGSCYRPALYFRRLHSWLESRTSACGKQIQVSANFALRAGGFPAPARLSCNGIRIVRPLLAPMLVLLRVCSGASRHGRTERPQRVPFPAGSGWRGPNSPLISPYHAPTGLRAVAHSVRLFSSALPP